MSEKFPLLMTRHWAIKPHPESCVIQELEWYLLSVSAVYRSFQERSYIPSLNKNDQDSLLGAKAQMLRTLFEKHSKST